MSPSSSRSDDVGADGSAGDPDTNATVATTLESAHEQLVAVDRRVDDHGAETVENAATAYREATSLLEGYVDRATGTGRENFKAYLELEGQFSALVDRLPEDLSHREAFEDALDAIDKRRLNERDFRRAQEALQPAAAFSTLLEERDTARTALEDAEKAAKRRLREIETERGECKRLLELADVDLEAPVELIREPIAAYNDAITEAFASYRSETAAREVFALLERSRLYPLVAFERPPEKLRAYVSEQPAGEYSIPKLLEYAEYSRSKLSHYVEDADELKRRVATRQTYLEGINAEPLTIGWPPPPASALQYHVRERQPFVARIADDDAVAALRAVRRLAADPTLEYDRLQTAATATAQLTDEEQRRLTDGRVEAELEALATERERIEAALEAVAESA